MKGSGLSGLLNKVIAGRIFLVCKLGF